MKILQIGAPKSGNFWLWKILQRVIAQAGLPNQSLIRSHPVQKLAGDWALSYDEQAQIDMLDIGSLGCWYRISSVFRMPVEDLGAYVAQCDHVWTHSRYCEMTPRVVSKFDRAVYIVRDPRDRLLSATRFAFTPYMQKFWPHGEASPESFLANRFDEQIDQWRWHVYDYLRHRTELDLHFVFFERLLHDFEAEFGRLLDYLGVELDAESRAQIRHEVDFKQMRRRNPGHVKKGRSGSWCDKLDQRQQGRAVVLAGPLLDLLGYPRYGPMESHSLPGLGEQMPTAERVEGVVGLLGTVQRASSSSSSALWSS